ncbi:MAG TPA: hypothetical protein VGF94_13670 [Kofleriaceae bacterium]|jgi:hypothetical protein
MWKTCSIALVLASCVPYASPGETDAGLRMLGVASAGGQSRADVSTTANELTRVLGERGFILHAQHVDAPDGEIALELWKTRPVIDSVYYAWVRPDGQRGSQIWMIGGPVQYVDADAVGYLDPSPMWGTVEDQVAQGAMSELELAGVVTGSLPPGAVPPVGVANVQAHAHGDCVMLRRQFVHAAAQQNDLDKRDEILQTAPECGA